ncbi:MAG TPA: ribosomal-processing cysteine protease Prp [Clostridiales bacterium]|nr:ribosomal-processing cysteine protease Prp [Clostridiales bacterium]
MINIFIIRNDSGKIKGFEVSGHAGYAQKGEDIVCAAVSAIIQTAVMGIYDVISVEAIYTQRDGYAKFALPNRLSPNQERNAHIILETMFVGLKSIENQYGSFVSIEESGGDLDV